MSLIIMRSLPVTFHPLLMKKMAPGHVLTHLRWSICPQHCYRQDSITAKRRQLYFPGNVNVTCKRISNPPYDLTYEIIGLPEIEKYEVTIRWVGSTRTGP
jgi:hypothetical protein